MNPNVKFPPYTYVPGQVPHPISHPDGHMYGEIEHSPTDEKAAINWGVQLFNRGYYWESHEIWEQVWLSRGRTTPSAMFVKALIKLAACGVKCLEGNEVGAKRHAKRAVELLNGIAGTHVDQGFDFDTLKLLAEQQFREPSVSEIPSDGEPSCLKGMQISLQQDVSR